MTDFVTYLGDETAYPYRRPDGEEFGYAVPADLIERLEAAEKAHDQATEAIRRYIEANEVPEVDLAPSSDADGVRSDHTAAPAQRTHPPARIGAHDP